MTDLPAATRLAWWGTAWLRGRVVTDLMLDAVIGDDATHTVTGMSGLGLAGPGPRPGAADEAAETLLTGLARIRAEGATGLGAAFPVEGDPCGLGGPVGFNAAALEAGEAVVALGADLGLVPGRVGAVVTWHAHPAARRPLPDVGEADRTLRRTLTTTADALAALQVGRWRPEVADRLMHLRHRPPVVGPDGVPARCVELLADGLQALEIVDLALEDDGGALSAHDIEARRSTLVPLARAGRHALVAACSPEVWPPS